MRSNGSFQTEVEFTLPKGYLDATGVLHRHGIMRLATAADEILPLRDAREVFEREYLVAQISRFGGNISRTAEFVGMERSALHRKLKSLGVG